MKKVKHKIILGERYGYLTPYKTSIDKRNRTVYVCKCLCGNENIVRGYDLATGNVLSCGCLNGINDLDFNNEKTKLKRTYKNIKHKCYNPKNKDYARYGARGIELYSEWLNNFSSFYEWCVNNGYKANLTIDRIDNNGNYEPNNIRFVGVKSQANNRRNTLNLTINGKTKTFSEWCDFYDIKYQTAFTRYSKGYSNECIFSKEKFHNTQKIKYEIINPSED